MNYYIDKIVAKQEQHEAQQLQGLLGMIDALLTLRNRGSTTPPSRGWSTRPLPRSSDEVATGPEQPAGPGSSCSCFAAMR